MSEPVLTVHDVHKRYGAVEALRGVSFELCAGEVVGLVGDNGAGKTTLVKCIAGVQGPDHGEISIDGTTYPALSPELARERGIEIVHQNLSLVDTLSVAQNFFLNRELTASRAPLRWLGWMQRRAMDQQTRSAISALGVKVPDVRRPVNALSGGQRQMVAVARAVSWGQHIVVMDEPAAALGVEQSEKVLEFIRGLAGKGIAVIVISHNMQHVMAVADRIVVLRQGRKAGELDAKTTSVGEVVGLITGANENMEGAMA